jgi:hypothetical protein
MKSKAIDIINFVDESRAARWKLAVDEDTVAIKPYLENIGYRVLLFEKGLSDFDVHKELIKNKVNFFITKNGKDYLPLLGDSKTCYSLLWIEPKLFADIALTVKTIEGAIMYDKRLTASTYVKINGKYVTELPQKKKQNKVKEKNVKI